jgi:hypothetical protein
MIVSLGGRLVHNGQILSVEIEDEQVKDQVDNVDGENWQFCSDG